MKALNAAPAVFRVAVIFLGRILRRAAKHQVFEQVREAGLARLHFIARTGSDHDEKRNDIRDSRWGS